MGRKSSAFNTPFSALEDLKRELEQIQQTCATRLNTEQTEPKVTKAPVNDSELFYQAMRGIDRSIAGQKPRTSSRPRPPSADELRIRDEEEEAYDELVNLVEGHGTFDISDSDEFIEGWASGFDRRKVNRLRKGEFSVRAHLDLHGMTRDTARAAVEQFILKSQKNGHRCVLIVHGRGLNSKDNIPVLKGLLQVWLERGRIARSVLAFCTARPNDGGAGAVYVLLRRAVR